MPLGRLIGWGPCQAGSIAKLGSQQRKQVFYRDNQARSQGVKYSTKTHINTCA